MNSMKFYEQDKYFMEKMKYLNKVATRTRTTIFKLHKLNLPNSPDFNISKLIHLIHFNFTSLTKMDGTAVSVRRLKLGPT